MHGPMLDSVSRAWLMLSAAFLTKHLLADFILQTRWMVVGKEQARGWILPLSAHAAVHGVGTGLIAAVFAPALLWLGLIDAAVHFAVDRAKGVANRGFCLGPEHTPFWWLLGLDQTFHHGTHVLLIAAMVALAPQ